ncbi:MAG TPA: hypothetical protein VIZ43_10025 [Trebonia sp.]
MRSRYERLGTLDDVLERAEKLSLRAMIIDIEPLVSWWGNSQESLDAGVAMVTAKVGLLPTVRVLVFATNSVRRPSAVPVGREDMEVTYLASAGKPLRTAPYRDLPRPGAVVGDQVPTDGLLARRLGFTFLHYEPRLRGVPLGPRLMHRAGRLAVPLLFSRQYGDLPPGRSGTPPAPPATVAVGAGWWRRLPPGPRVRYRSCSPCSRRCTTPG